MVTPFKAADREIGETDLVVLAALDQHRQLLRQKTRRSVVVADRPRRLEIIERDVVGFRGRRFAIVGVSKTSHVGQSVGAHGRSRPRYEFRKTYLWRRAAN